MKKLLLGLGTLASVAAPVAAVIACDSGTNPDTTPGSTDGFKIATTDQSNALSALATAIANESATNADLGIDSGKHITKTEIKGAEVRFTYSDPAAIDGNRIITVSLTTFKITKVESLVNGDIDDNTSSVTSLATINAGLETVMKTAATELAKVDNPKNSETDKSVGTTGTPTGTNVGTGTKAAGGPAKVSADNAKLYTGTATANVLAADGTATVIITIKGDDFENHISGEAAQAIEALLTSGKTTADVKKVELIVTDGTTKVAYTKTVGNTGSANQNLNAAINAASKEIADANLLDHDVAFDATGAQTAMITKLRAITETGFAGANDILKALGNASKFTDANHVKVVFGKPIQSPKTPAQRLTYMLDEGVLGTFEATLEDTIKAAIAKLG